MPMLLNLFFKGGVQQNIRNSSSSIAQRLLRVQGTAEMLFMFQATVRGRT
jgi:hypothetical protein